jgi:endonuclease G, mitochondrial
MFLFRMIFGIFTGIAGIFVRNRSTRDAIALLLMVLTIAGAAGFFFYRNPALTPEPVANIMRKIPGLKNFKTGKDKNQPDDNQGDSDPGTDNPQSPVTETSFDFEKKKDFDLPQYKVAGQLVRHKGYTLYYLEPYEQALFVAYRLTGTETQGNADRSDAQFRPDPKVETGSALPDDYRGSGYDKGHIAPAADFKFSLEFMAESFYMSNMSPQTPELNRGIWRVLEEQVRVWARRDQAIYVVSGPELKPGLKFIGRRNKIAVPEKYFKVILDLHDAQPRMIGFILPNAGAVESVDVLKQFVVPVDEVEKMTGLDFFPLLPDDLETQLESRSEPEKWNWQKARKIRKK